MHGISHPLIPGNGGWELFSQAFLSDPWFLLCRGRLVRYSIVQFGSAESHRRNTVKKINFHWFWIILSWYQCNNSISLIEKGKPFSWCKHISFDLEVTSKNLPMFMGDEINFWLHSKFRVQLNGFIVVHNHLYKIFWLHSEQFYEGIGGSWWWGVHFCR